MAEVLIKKMPAGQKASSELEKSKLKLANTNKKIKRRDADCVLGKEKWWKKKN